MVESIYLEKTAIPTLPIWRLSVEQYHEMLRAGILTDGDPVELLEGWLVTKMTKNPSHRMACELVREAVRNILPEGWHIQGEQPITTADSEPEPDAMVVRGTLRDYPDRHPGPHEVALVIEVADSTLQRDQTDKKRLYARAGIAVYWILNLIRNRIEVYTDPTGSADAPYYRQEHHYAADDTIPVIIEGREIAQLPVKDLLP